MFGLDGSDAFVLRQVGYSVADVLAKCLYGLVIYKIARMKSAADDPVFAEAGVRRGSLVARPGDRRGLTRSARRRSTTRLPHAGLPADVRAGGGPRGSRGLGVSPPRFVRAPVGAHDPGRP